MARLEHTAISATVCAWSQIARGVVGGLRSTLMLLWLCLAAGLAWAADASGVTPAAAAAPAAREVRGHATDTPLARSAHPEARRALTELREQVASRPRVRVIAGLRVPFAPEGRLNAEQQLQQRTEIASSQDRVERLLNATPVVPRAARMHRFASVPYAAVEVDAAQLEQLALSAEVTSLQLDRRKRTQLAQSVPQIRAPALWTQGLRGKGTVVAVLDEGFDVQHPFLQGRVLRELCFSNDVNGSAGAGQGFEYSLCPGFAAQADGAGAASNCVLQDVPWACRHGTHVAGIAMGGGDPQVSFSGVAPEAGLIAVQVFNFFTPDNTLTHASADREAYDSRVVQGLEAVYALRNQYRIGAVNLSLGGGRYDSTAACDAANLAYKAIIDNLRAAGIATVVASGNAGYVDGISAPACVSSAVSVGAVWDVAGKANSGTSDDGTPRTDAQGSAIDRVVWFSNTASFVQLLAPGAQITSSVLRAHSSVGNYDAYSGTSMAAPHVAGCMALLKQSQPGATVDQMVDALRSSGVPVTDWRVAVTIPRIDCAAAHSALQRAMQLTLTLSTTAGGRVFSDPAGIACSTSGTASGNASSAACSASFAQGTRVTLNATADAGFRFAAWGGACSGSGPCVVTLDAARSVNAQFLGGAQVLSLTKGGSGRGSVTSTPAAIDCGLPCSASVVSVTAGSTVTLRAQPDAFSRFAGWSGACSGVADCVLTLPATPTQTVSVGAAFSARRATLAVQRSGPGAVRSDDGAIDCSGAAGERCSLEGDAGHVVSLQAITARGNRFVGWSGACSGAGLCVVTLADAQAVSARFEPVSFTLRLVKDGTGAGRVSIDAIGMACDAACPAAEQTVPLGSMLTIKAEPAPGSVFLGWEFACAAAGAGDCSLGLTEDATVLARFDGAPGLAASDTRITQLYVALYGRAPDAQGLAFWRALLEQGMAMGQIADRMLATAPSLNQYYPDTLSSREVIASVYRNVLGRSADAQGLDFWTARLQQAGSTRGAVIADIAAVAARYAGTLPEGVQSMRFFNQRVQVAQYFAQRDGRLQGATAVLNGVDGDAQRALLARNAVDRALPAFGGFRTGDSLSYGLTESLDGAAPRPYWITRYYPQVKPDGGFTTLATTLDGGVRLQFELDAQLQEQYQSSATRLCENNPKRDTPGPGLKVGDRWDYTYTRTCTEAGVTTVRDYRNSGEVVALETVTTRAGIFSALRLEYTIAASGGGSSFAYRYRCWRSTLLERTVKCEYADGASPTQGRSVYTQELVAIDAAAWPSAQRDAVRFAGTWAFQLGLGSAAAAGGCTLSASATGQVSGSCDVPRSGGGTQAVTVSGQVDGQGVVSAAGGSFTLSGQLASPVTGIGQWQDAGSPLSTPPVPSAAGAWAASHP